MFDLFPLASFSRLTRRHFRRLLAVMTLIGSLAWSAAALANSGLTAEAKEILIQIAKQIPPGILGTRESIRYFESRLTIDSEIDMVKQQAVHQCENLLMELSPLEATFGPKLSLPQLRAKVLYLYERDRLVGTLPAVKQLNRLDPKQRGEILKSILENPAEAQKLLERLNLSVSFSTIVAELINAPMEDVQEKLTSQWWQLDEHWSGIYGGAEISSSPIEIIKIHKRLGSLTGKLVDIGSGYGIPGLVFTSLNPDLHYLGLEIARPKIKAARDLANQFHLKNMEFAQIDLRKTELPPADYYYLYNPVHPELANSLFRQLNSMAAKRSFRVILFACWGDLGLLNHFIVEHDFKSNDGARILILQSEPN